jgi:hypothetical protein
MKYLINLVILVLTFSLVAKAQSNLEIDLDPSSCQKSLKQGPFLITTEDLGIKGKPNMVYKIQVGENKNHYFYGKYYQNEKHFGSCFTGFSGNENYKPKLLNKPYLDPTTFSIKDPNECRIKHLVYDTSTKPPKGSTPKNEVKSFSQISIIAGEGLKFSKYDVTKEGIAINKSETGKVSFKDFVVSTSESNARCSSQKPASSVTPTKSTDKQK